MANAPFHHCRRGRRKSGKDVTTFGSRWHGEENGCLWDFEGAVQVGTFSNKDMHAGALTAAGGYVFKDCPLTPQFWLGVDYASGTPNPKSGTNETFDQLFPFPNQHLP